MQKYFPNEHIKRKSEGIQALIKKKKYSPH